MSKELGDKKEGSKYPELPRTVSRMLSRVGYDELLDISKEFSSTQEYWRLFREELINQNEDRTDLDISHPTPKLKWWQKLIGGFKGRRY